MSANEQCSCGNRPCSCQLRASDRTAFIRQCKALAETIRRVRGYLPRAELYLDENNLNLMAGPSHEHDQPRQDRVLETFCLPFTDGGAW